MSARRERQRRRRRRGGAARVIIITVSVLVAATIIGALSAVGYVVGIANSAPDLDALKPQAPGRYSTVFASDGKTELGKISNDILSNPIPSDQMPQSVRDATVAIEAVRKEGGYALRSLEELLSEFESFRSASIRSSSTRSARPTV